MLNHGMVTVDMVDMATDTLITTVIVDTMDIATLERDLLMPKPKLNHGMDMDLNLKRVSMPTNREKMS